MLEPMANVILPMQNCSVFGLLSEIKIHGINNRLIKVKGIIIQFTFDSQLGYSIESAISTFLLLTITHWYSHKMDLCTVNAEHKRISFASRKNVAKINGFYYVARTFFVWRQNVWKSNTFNNDNVSKLNRNRLTWMTGKRRAIKLDWSFVVYLNVQWENSVTLKKLEDLRFEENPSNATENNEMMETEWNKWEIHKEVDYQKNVFEWMLSV